jgi:putative salt-induced outer membrane protein YdiY
MRYLILTGLAFTVPLALADSDSAPPKIWSGSVEMGYVSTTGNTNTSNIKGHADLKREKDQWRYEAQADALNTEEDDKRSAEKYFLSNKLDYTFAPNTYTFGYASYENDRFSGYDWQAVVAAGVGYRLLDTDTMTWDVEAGPGYRYSKVSENTEGAGDEKEAIARLSTKYQWKLSDTAVFQEELSVESGSSNTVTRSITSLKTNIVGQLAMKLSYTVKHNTNVPPDTRRSDTETAVTLVYGF